MKDKKNNLILWDVDGTLMHCGADGTKALNKTFQELYGVEDAFSKADLGSSMDSVILNRIMEIFRLDKNDLDKIKEVYVGILQNVLNENQNKRVLPGIREILDHIKESENSYSALLTSNLRRGAETKLESVGLNHYFHVGGFGDDLGEKWDAAEKGIYEAESYYNTIFSRKSIFLVGDTAYDIECAKRMGINSIGVATGWMEYEVLKTHNPDYLYRDLSNWSQVVFIQNSIVRQNDK